MGRWRSEILDRIERLMGKNNRSKDVLSFLKKTLIWVIPSLSFLYFRLFNKVDSNYNLPMTGFEPRISDVGYDYSTN